MTHIPNPTDLRSPDAQAKLTALVTICRELKVLGEQMPAKPQRLGYRANLTQVADYRDARQPLNDWKARMGERGDIARELATDLQLPLGIEIEATDTDGQPCLILGKRGRRPDENRWVVLDWYELEADEDDDSDTLALPAPVTPLPPTI